MGLRPLPRIARLGLAFVPFALGALTATGALAQAPSQGVDPAKKSIAVNFYDEPKSLDSTKATDQIAGMLLGHVNEGLTRLDPSNKPVPGVAESWELKSPTQYVFKLRKSALWSDGKPVTANDFIYAWRRTLDPKNASEYAFIMYFLKNGEKLNKGELKPEELGAKAIDDHTLQVDLERPLEFFPRLVAFTTYMPVREAFAKQHGESFAADADKLLYNGPYTIESWKHNASIKLVKNDKYWNKANINIDVIDLPYLIRDKNSEFNMFKDSKFALTWALTKDLLAEAQAAKMTIRKYNFGTVWFFQFNTTRKITGNLNFRKAIQYAINREEFVKQIEGIPGSKPAFGVIPDYMPGLKKTYGEEYGSKHAFKEADLAKAKEHLDMAKKELGLKEFPPITVLASDADNVRRDLEYFQRYLKEKLGIELKLDFQTFKIRLERTTAKDFDIVNSGWGPDYLDVMTFADLYTSWNGNNNSGWKNAKYDELISKASTMVDPKERLDTIFAAEKILVEEAPIVPYFQQARVYVQDPRLTGVLRRPIGADPDFYYAKITSTAGAKQ
jgi:oligopeptide transport system substrate-binding protein